MKNPNRQRLPERRPSITEKVEFRGSPVFVTVGFDPETSRVMEVFADVPTKNGSDLSLAIKDAACVLSIALQHGATLPELQHSLMSVPSWNGEEPGSVVGVLVTAAMAVESAAGGDAS